MFLSFALLLRKQKYEKKIKTDEKVLNTFYYMPFMSHTHTRTQTHTLTEKMRGKFSRFENKAEKCRKKLAIGLTLPNKLTRFRCDAEYQSPPDDNDIVRVLCVHPGGDGKRHETSHNARGTNGTEHSRFVWQSLRMCRRTWPATTIRCSTAASDCAC